MYIEYIKKLLKLHMEIELAICKQANDCLEEYFTTCQEIAVELGTALEQSEEHANDIVALLEQYCDLVYQDFTRLNVKQVATDLLEEENNVEKQERDICFDKRAWDEILTQVETEILKLEEKKLILFLPYNASMWDSLESVWEKLTKDKKNDVKVIPIPYYDKNADGSLGELHYELDRYPANVPVIDCQEFDFEKNRADEIYIHNPYDGGNTVTSVHPYFYAKNLKTLTDCLIYIPYFVLADPEPDSLASLQGIEHFCLLPGVLHAHKVYVQSEKMREAYIRNLTRNIPEEKLPRSYWEQKIINYGSPKLEKIQNVRSKKIEVPLEWQQIIDQKEENRKIILYNTSVANVITSPEQVLDKMENVLAFFNRQTENVVLLWRPHPLLRQTFQTNAPELVTHFDAIVENYKIANWGIYDDTPDLDRALVLADAYYGDASSLVQLFKETGKPIMIQNLNVLY